MATARSLAAPVARYLVAVLVATVFGSVVQTQFNAAAIADLGVPVPAGARLSMTLHDLVRFTPIYGAIVALTLLFALPAAAALGRLWPRMAAVWFAGAGAGGILVAFEVLDALLPMPTFVAATRSATGLAAMAVSAALGGVAYGLLRGRPRAPA